jgi:plasmid maintenance system killer protein
MNKKKSAKATTSKIEASPGRISMGINDMKTTSLRNKVTKKGFEAIRFHSKKHQEMYETGENTCKLTPAVFENFFEKIQILEMANDERDLYQLKSLGFHKLKKGNLAGKYAIWLNGNWRLIVELVEEEQSQYILIKDILDYH